jgi:hypothetical protein
VMVTVPIRRWAGSLSGSQRNKGNGRTPPMVQDSVPNSSFGLDSLGIWASSGFRGEDKELFCGLPEAPGHWLSAHPSEWGPSSDDGFS